MFQETLQLIGLSLNESKVYEALLHLGEANVNSISLKSRIHRRNVYDSLNKLVEKGLASEAFVKGEKSFKAADPSRLLYLLKEKESAISRTLPAMEKIFRAVEPESSAFVFRGIEGFKNYLQLILSERQTVYFIGAKAFWLDPRLRNYLPHFERERNKIGIKFMHLFDHEVKDQSPEILKLVGRPFRFLPPQYSSSTAIDIFGDYVVTFVGVQPGNLSEEPLQFVLKSKLLAEGYRTFFRFIWDHCGEKRIG